MAAQWITIPPPTLGGIRAAPKNCLIASRSRLLLQLALPLSRCRPRTFRATSLPIPSDVSQPPIATDDDLVSRSRKPVRECKLGARRVTSFDPMSPAPDDDDLRALFVRAMTGSEAVL